MASSRLNLVGIYTERVAAETFRVKIRRLFKPFMGFEISGSYIVSSKKKKKEKKKGSCP